jgi:hypothetical protein
MPAPITMTWDLSGLFCMECPRATVVFSGYIRKTNGNGSKMGYKEKEIKHKVHQGYKGRTQKHSFFR